MNKFYIAFFSILTFFLMCLFADPFGEFSSRVFITSICIQMVSLVFIFRKENIPYSLNKIFYLFSLFFFGIAPLLQFYNNSSFFGARNLHEREYFYMNLLILLILIYYQIFYTLFYAKKINVKNSNFLRQFSINKEATHFQTLVLLALSLLSFILVFMGNNFSFTSMLIRGGALKEVAIETKSTALIIYRVFQPLSMMCLLYYILSPFHKKTITFVLFLLTLITCSPLGMARFSAAALYIPLILVSFSFFRKKNVFSLAFILGLLVVFPFLNNFRYYMPGDELKVGLDMNIFLSGDFDSYQNFALVFFENIITYGRQLIGVLLFWVPRSIWPTKPIGSGAFVAEQQGFYFDNVSCNFFAEGYINFGIIGIFVFAVVLAYVTARIDKYYWNVVSSDKNNYFQVIYFVLIGMLFFILRGDLMSSFAYTVGFLFSIFIVQFLMGLRFKK